MITSGFYGYNGSYVEADTLMPGQAYWVKSNDEGRFIFSTTAGAIPENRIRIISTSEQPPPAPLEISSQKQVPEEFTLGQNYPNPFNPSTTVRYELPVSAHVSLNVYNMLGQTVATLVDEVQEAGYKSVRLDASNLASGMYYYHLKAGSFSKAKKMLLIK
jgi:hypothetical protein